MNEVPRGFCPHCGAADYGTRFCSGCGQEIYRGAPSPYVAVPFAGVAMPSSGVAMPAASVAMPTAGVPLPPIAPKTTSSLFYVLGAIAYLLVLFVPPLLSFVTNSYYYSYGGGFDVFSFVYLLLLGAAGVLVALGALTSVTSSARRVTGAVFGFVLLLAPLIGLLPFGYGAAYILLSIVSLFFVPLFLAWGISRPFRGPGYFALLIWFVVSIVATLLSRLLFQFPPLFAVIECIPPVVAVLTARAFERRRPAQALPPYATTGGAYPAGVVVRGTNPLATMSLIFSLVGAGVVGLILGHVARGQIRRTGEHGEGMALAGVIIGYVQTALLVIVLIVSLALNFSILR